MQLIAKSIGTGILLLASALLLMGLTSGCSTGGERGFHTRIMVANRATSRPAWLPDGSAILFSRDLQGTFLVDIAGSRLRKIPGTVWNKSVTPGSKQNEGEMSAALSPDGSRVAYVGLARNVPEIRAADLDRVHSTIVARHPRGGHILYPAWSPDGSRIAFLTGWHLTIVSADGSSHLIFEQSKSEHPPTWSPDGSWIAIAENIPTQGDVSQIRSFYTVLTLVRPDGSGLTRVQAVGGISHENQTEPAVPGSELNILGALASVPAWSPDGSQVAFFQVEEGSIALYTVELAAVLAEEPIEARKLLSMTIEKVPSDLQSAYVWYTILSWSPDGTALLFTSDHLPGHVVNVADGSVITDLETGWAAWSPDSARIAVVTSLTDYANEVGKPLREVLYTIARDGTDKQVLVRGNLEQFVAAGAQ